MYSILGFYYKSFFFPFLDPFSSIYVSPPEFIAGAMLTSEKYFVLLFICLVILSTCLVTHNQVNMVLKPRGWSEPKPKFTSRTEPKTENLEIDQPLLKPQIANLQPRCLGMSSWMSQTRMATRGNYWVLYNFYKATKELQCFESVTYVTQGEFHYLDNLWPVLQRWQGPMSVAIYAPSSDFIQAIQLINYYRNCLEYSPQIVEWVSFHLFYPLDHQPQSLNVTFSSCQDFNIESIQAKESYRKSMQLDYPVNVARMIARESATTHYVFTSDIELYPSPNLISQFLQMIKQVGVSDKTVWVTPIFEIKADASLPNNKVELVQMLKDKTAIVFHQNFCEACHKVPHFQEWLTTNNTGLSVFKAAKRTGMWEPIYIGTNQDPPYDERLSWEGRSDKMTQGFILCLLDYNFAILDNGFLVHRPGIKSRKDNFKATPANKVFHQKNLIKTKIAPELNRIYGSNKDCYTG